jgi:hypothetical protein
MDLDQYDLDNQPETDEEEYIDRPSVSNMTAKQKEVYVKELWKKCIRKSMGAALVLS